MASMLWTLLPIVLDKYTKVVGFSPDHLFGLLQGRLEIHKSALNSKKNDEKLRNDSKKKTIQADLIIDDAY